MLFIYDHTVKDHVKSIYRKTNVHSRLELAALVSKHRTMKKLTERSCTLDTC